MGVACSNRFCIVDIEKIKRILDILHDGAVTPKEGKELIDGIGIILDSIRPQLKKWWLRVLLDGIKVSLMELKEHLEEIDK
jgi:hypothetical protein